MESIDKSNEISFWKVNKSCVIISIAKAITFAWAESGALVMEEQESIFCLSLCEMANVTMIFQRGF